jgi:outer membrane protein assembly factor BamD
MKSVLFKILPFVFALILVGASCKYQKLLKSTDNELKYTKAKEFYQKEDYARAMTLLEQLVPIFRGSDRGEEVSYLYAYCNYYLRDYIMAGHYFRKFSESFGNSQYAMETAYMSAYCYYLDAPKQSLDQETTIKAINEFELYISKYPTSDKIARCNELIDELQFRLQEKAFNNAMLYYKLEQYKAAVVALKANLKEYPDSKFREDILFNIVKSSYLYAINSIFTKTKIRLIDAGKNYKAFVRAYPSSKYSKEADRIFDDITKKIGNIN